MFKNKIIFSAFLLSLAFSCSNQGDEESNVPFEVVLESSFSSVSDKRQVAIKNNEDYQKLMSEVYKDLDQMPRFPDADFTKNSIIAVFMGPKSSGGYSVSIDKIKESSGKITVYTIETAPGKNCVVTQAETRPYIIVRIPKIDKEVKFKTKETVKDCQ
jgi:hypothetical protein